MRTIVCGIDGSPEARSALRVAMQLADALSLRVVALHVADAFGDDPKLADRLRARGNAERLLANVLYDEQLLGRVDWRAEVGDVAAQLAAIAAEEQALLIVLGARRKGKAQTLRRGGLARRIIGESAIPVIVVPPQRASALENAPLSRPRSNQPLPAPLLDSGCSRPGAEHKVGSVR